MENENLHIIAPDPAAHTDALCALLDLEWEGIDIYLRAGRLLHSHYDWATSPIGLLGQRLVTHYGVYDITMRIGSARVRAAGVNVVVTHPGLRQRGFMEQTGRAAVAAMHERGYDLSVICNGTAGYYGRLGYVLGWTETDFVIQTEDLPAASPDVVLDECATEQHDDFVALYNHENANVTGTAVRPTFPHGKHPGNGHGVRWTATDGTAGGYIFYDIHEPSNTLWHDDSAGDVLGGLVRRSVDRRPRRASYATDRSGAHLCGTARHGTARAAGRRCTDPACDWH